MHTLCIWEAEKGVQRPSSWERREASDGKQPRLLAKQIQILSGKTDPVLSLRGFLQITSAENEPFGVQNNRAEEQIRRPERAGVGTGDPQRKQALGTPAEAALRRCWSNRCVCLI